MPDVTHKEDLRNLAFVNDGKESDEQKKEVQLTGYISLRELNALLDRLGGNASSAVFSGETHGIAASQLDLFLAKLLSQSLIHLSASCPVAVAYRSAGYGVSVGVIGSFYIVDVDDGCEPPLSWRTMAFSSEKEAITASYRNNFEAHEGTRRLTLDEALARLTRGESLWLDPPESAAGKLVALSEGRLAGANFREAFLGRWSEPVLCGGHGFELARKEPLTWEVMNGSGIWFLFRDAVQQNWSYEYLTSTKAKYRRKRNH